MTFSLYALLPDGAPDFTNESLAVDLGDFFRGEEGFSVQFENLPFAKSNTLALRWSDWLVRVSYEEGPQVAQDSVEIAKIVNPTESQDFSRIYRRIRAVFGDDDGRNHTNQIISFMDFIQAIPSVIIYDPQQRDLVKIPH
jgi:hypothetical protein